MSNPIDATYHQILSASRALEQLDQPVTVKTGDDQSEIVFKGLKYEGITCLRVAQIQSDLTRYCETLEKARLKLASRHGLDKSPQHQPDEKTDAARSERFTRAAAGQEFEREYQNVLQTKIKYKGKTRLSLADLKLDNGDLAEVPAYIIRGILWLISDSDLEPVTASDVPEIVLPGSDA